MTTRQRIPFKKKLEIWEAVKKGGISHDEIAKIEGVSTTSVNRIGSGKKPVDAIVHYKNTSPEEKQTIIALYKQGTDTAVIAHSMKRAFATVSNQIEKYKADPAAYEKAKLPPHEPLSVAGPNLETCIAGVTQVFQEWAALKKENAELKAKLARVAELFNGEAK